MIHYTILPEEIVWDGYEKLAEQSFSEVVIGGITMVVQHISATEARIERIISPNPYDYTNPRLAPGSLIQYVPSFHSGENLPPKV